MKEKHKDNNNKKQNKGDGSYSERVRDKWFCWAFKLGFLQIICKASLIFKSNLELALSKEICFKGKRIIWDKVCCGGV